MAKISAVTESDWTQREDSRSAYLKLSVVNSGVMEERMRLTAEGDMLLNTDSFIVDGPTGDTLIHGNVLVTSRDGTDERELAITSSANTASLRVEGGDTSPGTMIIKGGATGNAEATLQGGEDMDASLTFVDPSATDGRARAPQDLDPKPSDSDLAVGGTRPARSRHQQRRHLAPGLTPTLSSAAT